MSEMGQAVKAQIANLRMEGHVGARSGKDVALNPERTATSVEVRCLLLVMVYASLTKNRGAVRSMEKRLGVTLILTPIIANCVSARHCRES